MQTVSIIWSKLVSGRVIIRNRPTTEPDMLKVYDIKLSFDI